MLKRILLLILLCHFSLFSVCERKKVGLVLSGGGAKGVAHIGVLKVLEEAGIPIDYISGTSMGALIGALYAIGYDSHTLDSLVRNQDWRFLLGDQAERSDLPFAAKEADGKYLVSLPFSKKGVRMPAGMISGQNIYNLFTELTLGYHDSISFSKLPIPFACIAADLVTGNEIVMKEGVLPRAMRASMAIPGVFAPVQYDNMVLVDGGIANNFPVNVCEEMGAEVLIGVDLSMGLKGYGQINSVTHVVEQMANIMGLRKYRHNKQTMTTDSLCALYLNPNLKGFTAASFSPVAIDTMIAMGERVARANWDRILALKKEIGIEDSAPIEVVREEKDIESLRTDSLAIARIWIEGVGETDKKWIKRFLTLKEYSVVTFKDIHQNLAYLYGTDAFANVSYQLNGKNIYDLRLVFTRKGGSSLNLGFRFDTEDMAAILVNTTFTNSYLRGSRVSLTARLSQNPYVKVDYSFGNPFLRRLALSYMYKYSNLDWYQKGERVDNVTFNYNKVQISFFDLYFKNIKTELGIKYEYYDYGKFLYAPNYEAEPARSRGYFTYYGSTQVESLDNKYFPTRGAKFEMDYSLMTTNLRNNNGQTPFSAIGLDFLAPIKLTNRVYAIPAVYGRVLIGQDIPYPFLNCMGGDMPGRYMPQQLPFIGIHNLELFDNSVVTLQANFRYRLGRNHYLFLMGNYAKQQDNFFKILQGNDIWGGGVKYAYNSLIGPVAIMFDMSNWNKKLGVYFNLGYYF
ncbi:MAG: patatin-like phospholipase family protein [Marinifilaceae bacterium]